MLTFMLQRDQSVLDERILHDSVDVLALHEFYSDGDATEEMFEYWNSSPHETVKETYDYLDEVEQLWSEATEQ